MIHERMTFTKKILMTVVFACSGLCGFLLSWYIHRPQVHQMQVIDNFHHPVSFVAQLSGDQHAGKQIFKEFCATCHAKKPYINIRAPRIGDKKNWQALKMSGMPTLLKVTIKGAGAMPARGGCFECSDEQLQQAIQYILKHSE